MRQTFRKHLVLAGGAALLFCSSAFGQAVSTDARMDRTVAEPGTDAKIHSLCVQKLGPDAEPIRVTVDVDKAILEGEVASRPVQRLAREVALSVPGIQRVDDRITLSRSLPAAGKSEKGDSALKKAARDRLVSDFGARTLIVEAVDGWVSVRGKLPDETRRDQAIRALKGLDGVTRVVDLITIAP